MRLSILAAILIVAAGLRMYDLTHSPPGLNQDEAMNAWTAWCMLKTGHDHLNKPWPVFYMTDFGDNRSTLHLYFIMPFQAVGGLNVWTLRLPSAVGGVAAVLLAFVVGRRLFGERAGLIAAATMALNPWHIQQCRWGHEAAFVPLLVLLPVAMMLWANFPLDESQDRKLCPLVALLAGLVTGTCCYGYPAVRMFIPIFLIGLVGLLLPSIWAMIKTRRGGLAMAGFVVGVAATFGPLVYVHMTDSEINRRGKYSSAWEPTDSTSQKLSKMASRYPGHLGPDFLFSDGDHSKAQSPPGMGMFYWYSLPLMLAGLVAVIVTFFRSRSSRLLLLWLVIYPIPDCFTFYSPGAMGMGAPQSMHALRSLVGLPALVLLEGLGAAVMLGWLWKNMRESAYVVAGVLVSAGAILNVMYLHRFFGEYNRDRQIYADYQVDLLEASQWLRPRLAEHQRVFVDMNGLNQPYAIMLVGLQYDPVKWLKDEQLVVTADPQRFQGLAQCRTAPFPPEMPFAGTEWRTSRAVRQGGLHLRHILDAVPCGLAVKRPAGLAHFYHPSREQIRPHSLFSRGRKARLRSHASR